MPSPREPGDAFTALPDPGQADTLDGLVERLRLLKVWAGDPSYESIKDRINASWTAAGRPAGELARKTTVVDCFRPGRRRVNTDLFVGVVQALHPDPGYVAQWRQALRVIGGEIQAASQVRVQDSLPRKLAEFTGRTAELDQLRRVVSRDRQDGGAVVVSAIEGMAGIGKTQLAIHAGHMLLDENQFDRVLFVNLRGFHSEPTQPPADPAAVLDGFLRLLGLPGHKIPHALSARAAAYRDRLAGTRTLVVLDNAATEEQVRPLLPGTPGCLTLVTSRRSLTGLPSATHLAVDVFAPEEAVHYLATAAPGVPVGPDPRAPARIARRCGYLPLALGLVAGHIRGTPGWTLTDHADRLEERHHDRRLDTGVELALDLSYRSLPVGEQRLSRLLALHPGQDFDAHAAAALADVDLPTARAGLSRLSRDNLLQQSPPDRHNFHDLVRVYAAERAGDEDRPAERRAALTRLFDYYTAASAAAMDTLFAAETHLRPRIPPVDTPTPTLTDPDSARAWLDTERPTLVAVAVHTATHGWPAHTIRLSDTLFRYLAGGHHADAVTIHGHASRAAHDIGDLSGQASALRNLGTANGQLGLHGPATDQFRRALALFQQTGDRTGQARTLGNLGNVEQRLGHFQPAADYYEQALALFREAGDRTGQSYTLGNLGTVEGQLGRYQPAADHYEQALTLFRQAGDQTGEAAMLTSLGDIEVLLGRYEPAGDHLRQALALCRRVGHRSGEGWTLDSLGKLHTHLGQPDRAIEFHRQALAIFRESGDRPGEAWALNGLGEAARAAGRAAESLTHHADAYAIVAEVGVRDQQARAHAGLANAHRDLGDLVRARQHYQHALTLYTELGLPEADQIRTRLATIEATGHEER